MILLVNPGERSFLHSERDPKGIDKDLAAFLGLSLMGSDLVGDSEKVVSVWHFYIFVILIELLCLDQVNS